jgi:hypothetical protein
MGEVLSLLVMMCRYLWSLCECSQRARHPVHISAVHAQLQGLQLVQLAFTDLGIAGPPSRCGVVGGT